MKDQPNDQSWFWTEMWQAMEVEADLDIVEGRVQIASSVDEFLANLDD